MYRRMRRQRKSVNLRTTMALWQMQNWRWALHRYTFQDLGLGPDHHKKACISSWNISILIGLIVLVQNLIFDVQKAILDNQGLSCEIFLSCLDLVFEMASILLGLIPASYLLREFRLVFPINFNCLQDLREKIQQHYRVRLILDNLPITTYDLEDEPESIRPGYQVGMGSRVRSHVILLW